MRGVKTKWKVIMSAKMEKKGKKKLEITVIMAAALQRGRKKRTPNNHMYTLCSNVVLLCVLLIPLRQTTMVTLDGCIFFPFEFKWMERTLMAGVTAAATLPTDTTLYLP